jgi:hypothetical protein
LNVKEYEDEKDEDGDFDWKWKRIRFNASDLKKIESQAGASSKFVFVNSEGITLTLNKIKEKSFSYYDAF